MAARASLVHTLTACTPATARAVGPNPALHTRIHRHPQTHKHTRPRSPAEPLMAVYTAESGQTAARVTLMKFPEKTELRQKNMYSVSGAWG